MLRYMRKHGAEVVSDVVASKANSISERDRSGQRLFCCSKHWDICWLAMRHTRLWIVRPCRTVVCRKPKATAAIGLAERKAVEAIMVAGITASSC